jgi:CTP:molybdopterin cytidylyltransferase MocA
MFSRLALLNGDEGARSILASPEYRGLAIDEPLTFRFLDADTLEDIEKIMSIQE